MDGELASVEPACAELLEAGPAEPTMSRGVLGCPPMAKVSKSTGSVVFGALLRRTMRHSANYKQDKWILTVRGASSDQRKSKEMDIEAGATQQVPDHA